MTLPKESDSKYIFDTSLGTLIKCDNINETTNSLNDNVGTTSGLQNIGQSNTALDYTKLPRKYFQHCTERASVIKCTQYTSFCNVCKYKFFICNYCLKCFIDKSKLDTHKRNTHDKHPLEKYLCLFCNTNQPDKETFKKHIRLHVDG